MPGCHGISTESRHQRHHATIGLTSATWSALTTSRGDSHDDTVTLAQGFNV